MSLKEAVYDCRFIIRHLINLYYDYWYAPPDELELEAEIAIWRALKKWRAEGKFTTYAYKFVNFAMVDYIRREARHRARHVEYNDTWMPRSDGHIPLVEFEVEFGAFLTGSHAIVRDIITMRYYGTMTWAEIGRRLGIGESTAIRFAQEAFEDQPRGYFTVKVKKWANRR